MNHPNKLLDFNGYAQYIHLKYPKIWHNVNTDSRVVIAAIELQSFCIKIKNQFFRHGTWNITSDNINGLWEPFHELLVKLGFPFAS